MGCPDKLIAEVLTNLPFFIFLLNVVSLLVSITLATTDANRWVVVNELFKEALNIAENTIWESAFGLPSKFVNLDHHEC